MHRLVQSSKPGQVERDHAIRLLTERAVLTRALCRELLDSDGVFNTRRAGTVLSWLLNWVSYSVPDSIRVEPHASDGLDSMVVPENCGELLQEIKDGARVCDDFFMLLTADNSIQSEGDRARIRKSLDAYWIEHEHAAQAPSVYSSE
jgi:hypothetical protein